jgi:hypothetical protein
MLKTAGTPFLAAQGIGAEQKRPRVFLFLEFGAKAPNSSPRIKSVFVRAESPVLPQAGCAQKQRKIYAVPRLPPMPRLWLSNFSPIYYYGP